MEAAEDERPTPGRAAALTPKGGGGATPKTKRNYVKLPPGRKLELLKMLDAGVSKETLMKEFSVSRTTLYLYKMNIDKMKHQLMTNVPGGSGGPRRKRKRRARLGWKKILPQTDDEELVVNPKVEQTEETKAETPPPEEPLPSPPTPSPSQSTLPPLEPEPYQPLLPPPLAPPPITNHSRRGKRKRKSINLPRKHSKNRWMKLYSPTGEPQQLSTITAITQMTSPTLKYSVERSSSLDQSDRFKTEGRTRGSTSSAQDTPTPAPKPKPPGKPAHSELGTAGAKGDQLHVQHNFHSQKILEVLTCDETFIDVTLTAEGRSVRAHKLILSAMSPYFQEVLQTNPCQHPVIIMPRTVRFSHLTQIIDFIYRGEITLPEEELRSLLNTAEHLQISGFSTPEIMKLLGDAPSTTEDTTLTPTASSHLLTPTSEEIAIGRQVEAEVQLEVEPIRGGGRGRGGVRRGRGGRRTRGGRRGRGRGRLARSSEDIISSCGQRLVRATHYTPPFSTSLSPSPTPSPSLPPLPASPEPPSSPPARSGSPRTFQRVEGGHLRHPVDDPISCSPGTVLGMDVDIDIVKEEVLSESEDNVSEGGGENVVFIVEGESLQVCPDTHHPSLSCGTLQGTPTQPLPPPLFTTATQPLLPRPTVFSGVASVGACRGVSSPSRSEATATFTPATPLFESRFEIATQPARQPSQGVTVASTGHVRSPPPHNSFVASSPAPHSDGSYMVTSPASHSEVSYEAATPTPQSEASYAVASPACHREGLSMATSPTPHSESSYVVTSPTVQSEASYEATSPTLHSEASSSDEETSPSHSTSYEVMSPSAQEMRCKAATHPPPPSPLVAAGVASPTPVHEAGHQAVLQATQNPMATSQAPHSPKTTSQAPQNPMATPQAPASPMATSQTPASPMTNLKAPHSPVTTSQAPQNLMAIPQVPASPMTTSQAPQSPMTISQAPHSPMTTSQAPPSPMKTPQAPHSPITTSQAPQSPMATLQDPQTPMATSHSPMTTSQSLNSPMAISPPCSPMTTSHLPHSPTTTSLSSHSPTPALQLPHTPMVTSQPSHSPMLTTQPPHSPTLTSLPLTSPIFISQPSASPTTRSLPSHSPTLTSQTLTSPPVTSQPSNSPMTTLPTPSTAHMDASPSVVHSAATSPRQHSVGGGGAASPTGVPQTASHLIAFPSPPHEVGSPPHMDRQATTSPPPPSPPVTHDVPLPLVEEALGEVASSPIIRLSHQAASSSPPPPPQCEAGHPSPQRLTVDKVGSPLPHHHPEASGGAAGLLPPTPQSSLRAPSPPLLPSSCVASNLPHIPGISGVSASLPHKATAEAAVLLPPLLRGAAACLVSQQPTVSTPATSPLLPSASTTTTSTATPPQHHDDSAPELSTSALLGDLSSWSTNPTQYQPSCETIPLQYPETSSLQYSSELGNFQISQGQYSDLGYQASAPQYQPSYETIAAQYSESGYHLSPPHYTKLVYGTNPPQYTTPTCQTSPLQQYQPNFEASTLQYNEPTTLETFPAQATYGVTGCEPGEPSTVAAPTTSPTIYYDPSCPDSPHHLQYSQL